MNNRLVRGFYLIIMVCFNIVGGFADINRELKWVQTDFNPCFFMLLLPKKIFCDVIIVSVGL